MRNIGMLLVRSWLLVTVGCATTQIPESSLTGSVFDVKIGDLLTPKVVTVKDHDEVRWINTSNYAVHISLKKPVSARLSCIKGFVFNEGFEFVASQDPDSIIGATVNRNDFASLCFSDRGIYEYTVRTDDRGSATEGPKLDGTVMVK